METEKINISNEVNQNATFQLKSWHIALAGTIIQAVLIREAIFYLLFSKDIPPLGAILFIPLFIYSIIGIISIFPLYFIKTKKIGAIISIILGLVSISFFVKFYRPEEGFMLGTQGIFLIFAGLYYFWKKV